jgi:hypothetical protein
VLFYVPWLSPFCRGTPVARDIVCHPGVEFKSVEGNSLSTDRDGGEVGAYLGVEAVAIHAEIIRRVPQPDDARQ